METQSSQKMLFTILGIVALVIVGYGGYKVWHHFSKSTMQPTTAMTSTQPAPTNQPTQNAQHSGLSNKTDTSNTQLDQDLQSVQNSMNQLQQDQSTANNDSTTQSQDFPQQ